jgi:hypothetical protein
MPPREVNKPKAKPKPSRQYEDSKAGEEQRDRLAEIVKVTKPIAVAPTNKTRRMKGK